MKVGVVFRPTYYGFHFILSVRKCYTVLHYVCYSP